MALLGDARNDETLLVSQTQGAFIVLHNILMTMAVIGNIMYGDSRDCVQMGTSHPDWSQHAHALSLNFKEARR
ncbi:MAG: hypothetical protein GDA36_04585 [Rhodobacteraceae bacterium]|nr:hypothetical protein [Paracoccaceae bacterium]